MKRWMLMAVLICTLVLIATVVVVVVVSFSSRKSEEKAPAEPIQMKTVEAYVGEAMPELICDFNEATQTLTLSKETGLSYETACLSGNEIYEGDTAPETYLESVKIIGMDVKYNCDCPELTVILQYLSTDGKVIFSVCDDGTVKTCWETE